MTLPEALTLIEQHLPRHPLLEEAFKLVKTHAFNDYILKSTKGVSYTPYRSESGRLIGFKREEVE